LRLDPHPNHCFGDYEFTQNPSLMKNLRSRLFPLSPPLPTEIIDDPLFEPVEVIQEGAGNVSQTAGEQDLGQIAQKIKEESMQNAPVSTTRYTKRSVERRKLQTAVAPTPKPAPVAPIRLKS
jgi:hypothetical protein